MIKNEKIHAEMREGRIAPLILKLSLPNTIGLLVIAAYSLADSFFVGSLGTAASAAVGVCFSLHVLIQAIGYTLGMGGGSLLSRALGRREEAVASRYAALAFAASLCCGVAVTVLGLWMCEPLLALFGASGDVLAPARAYVRPFLWTAPLMCAVFVLSQLLRAEGRAFYSMAGLLVGSLLNIALDPLFIHAFDLGIAGASVATLISQGVSACVLLSAYLFGKSAVSLSPKCFWGTEEGGFRLLLRVLAAGLPSLFRQGLSGMAAILLNHAAATVGDSAVAAMSLVSRIFLLVFSLCLGIGQGMMPVVGYNRGAGDVERMKRAFSFSLLAASLAMLAVSIPIYALAPTLLSLFQKDAEVIRVGTSALRAQSLVLVTHGIVTSTILYLQAVGQPLPGTVLAAARQGIFFLPLIALLPSRFGLWGLEWTQPLSDLASLLFALPFLFFVWKNLKKEGHGRMIFSEKA